jgi:hypothetical protein
MTMALKQKNIEHLAGFKLHFGPMFRFGPEAAQIYVPLSAISLHTMYRRGVGMVTMQSSHMSSSFRMSRPPPSCLHLDVDVPSSSLTPSLTLCPRSHPPFCDVATHGRVRHGQPVELPAVSCALPPRCLCSSQPRHRVL